MTVFQNYFDALGHNIRVIVASKIRKESRVVTLKVAAMMTGVSCGDLMEGLRMDNSYEAKHFVVYFDHNDNGPEHMPKESK